MVIIISLKNIINSKREIFTYNAAKSQIIITNWLIGYKVRVLLKLKLYMLCIYR